MRDLHTMCRTARGVAAQTVGTTGTGRTGVVVDTAPAGCKFGGVEFIVNYGTVTATNAVFTVVMKEGDVTGTLTSVADADMLGTELLAGLAAAATRTSDVSKNVTKRVGYKGYKRYVNLSISSTITAGTPIAITALLHTPEISPVPNP